MKTIDLRPWAVAVIASVYTLVFWIFQPRQPRPSSDGDTTVWYDALPTASRPDVPVPPGWMLAHTGEPPSPAPQQLPTRAPRVRTRSS